MEKRVFVCRVTLCDEKSLGGQSYLGSLGCTGTLTDLRGGFAWLFSPFLKWLPPSSRWTRLFLSHLPRLCFRNTQATQDCLFLFRKNRAAARYSPGRCGPHSIIPFISRYSPRLNRDPDYFSAVECAPFIGVNNGPMIPFSCRWYPTISTNA